LSRPIMARSHRESHHSDGITNQKSLQQTSATKSALFGQGSMYKFQSALQAKVDVTSSGTPSP
jgi:hypothetical protein